MFVRHVMSQQVFVLTPERSCVDAFRELRSRRIRRAPVVEHGHLVGIVTEHDLLRILPGTREQEQTPAGHKAEVLPIAEVMSKQVLTVHPNDNLEAAALLMMENKVAGLPVVRNDEIVGMITESDIFRALWGVLSTGAGWRVILEEHAGRDAPDYAALLQKQGCTLRSLLRFPLPPEGGVVFLRAEGAAVEGVVKLLWSTGVTVLQIERPAPVAVATPRPAPR